MRMFNPPHPGEILAELWLEPLKLTITQAAKNLNVTRKTKLTLAQLNRLRIMNDVRKLEHEEKLTTLKTQYKAAPDESGMPAM